MVMPLLTVEHCSVVSVMQTAADGGAVAEGYRTASDILRAPARGIITFRWPRCTRECN